MTAGRDRRRHVVVIGDLLLDVDLTGRSDRLCPDAPAPVVDLEGRRESPGGAGLTALLCRAPMVDVTLVAPVADDDGGRRLRELLDGKVRLLELDHDGGTRTKTRVRAAGHTLLRLDSGGSGRPLAQPNPEVREALSAADVVLVSDYGGGTTSHPPIRELLTDVARRTPVVWDPHPRGGAPVPGVAVVSPNQAEAHASVGDPHLPPEELASRLRENWSARAVCVTAGESGAYLSAPGGEPLYVPSQSVSDGDPCGAGDRFAATLAVCLAQGALLSEAVVAAVDAASSWVAAGGAAAYRQPDREHNGDHNSNRTPHAVIMKSRFTPSVEDPPSAQQVMADIRSRGGRVVATGGCFDVLHAGHVSSLEAARRMGDGLVVLLNSDESVRRSKGDGRPVNTAEDRARVLLGLGCVDAVEIFEDDDPSATLERLRPDVWAKGADYGGTVLPEAEVVRGYGGRVVLLPYLAGRSTTRILNDLINEEAR
ncbi:MAG TPA: PfkB family carbohydrate kinase [Actinomycetales bacterium]|nr:PfkB family carbohydrate kinase [Actinomycetales bacterium]